MREHDHDPKSFRHVMPEACRQLKPVKVVQGVRPAARLSERAELCLLPLDRLVIDERYQRPVTEKGRASISRILAKFDWRKFTPVVVVSVGGGYYAIIDGQHRATAALMHPDIDMVPCMVVEATLAEAAETFAAINGQVTSVMVGQVFRARLASGEAAAVEVADACATAGVTLLPHKHVVPMARLRSDARSQWKVGETLAVATVERAFKAFGRDTLITALQCITETGDGNPGALRSTLIWALCDVLAARRDWRDAGSRLLAAFDDYDFPSTVDDAAGEARRTGYPRRQVIAHALSQHLARALSNDAVRQLEAAE